MALVSTETQLRSMSAGPERFMTMNLMSSGPCTVSSNCTSYGRAVHRMNTRDNHTTADVDGARTFVRTSTLTNKPDSYGVSDISGTASMRLHRHTNKPDRQLFLDDIDGSKPRNKWLFRTHRCVDPLEPSYALPSFVVEPNIAPKFTRDSYDVSDIEGTKSRPLYPLAQRQNHLVDDIEGARSGWKPRHVRARHDAAPLDHSLNVSDITGGGFRTRRATNPLTPSYRVNGMDIADDPVTSKPRALPKARDSPFYPLTTLDIEGAQPGWRPLPYVNPPLEARRHFRNTNFMGDIPGAQADTVKHSICTDRHVNPLNPVYTSLDGVPLANPQTPLYKEPGYVEAEAQLDRTIAAEDAAAANAPHQNSQLSEKKASGRASAQGECGQRHQRLNVSTQQRPSSEPLQSGRDDISSGSRGGSAGKGDGHRGGQFSSRNGNTALPARAFSSGDSRRILEDSNDKDKLIRRLQKDVQFLRKNREEAWQRRPPSGAVDTAASKCRSSGVRTTARSWPPSSSGRRQHSRHAVSHASKCLATEKPHPCSGSSWDGVRSQNTRSAGGAAPRQPSNRSRSVDSSGGATGGGNDQQSGGGGGAMVVRSRGEQGGPTAERLVLRSANGTPRVPLTPSERRSAQEYTDEVSSVRDLL